MLKQMRDEDLVMPVLWKPAAVEPKSLHRRYLHMLVRCVEFLDGEQLAGELVVRTVDVTDYVIEVAGDAWQKIMRFSFEDPKRGDRRRVVVQIERNEPDRWGSPAGRACRRPLRPVQAQVATIEVAP